MSSRQPRSSNAATISAQNLPVCDFGSRWVDFAKKVGCVFSVALSLAGCESSSDELPDFGATPLAGNVENVNQSGNDVGVTGNSQDEVKPELPQGFPGDELAAQEGCSLPSEPNCSAARVVIRSQQAMDAFMSWGCSSFAGDVIIEAGECTGESQVESLLGLQGLVDMGGELSIGGLAGIGGWEGLANLRSLKALNLEELDLADLSAFRGLNSVRDLSLTRLSKLATLSHLGSLRITRSLRLVTLPALADDNGIEMFDLGELKQMDVVDVANFTGSRPWSLGSTLNQLRLVELPLLAGLGFLGDLRIESSSDDASLELSNLPALTNFAALSFSTAARTVKIAATALSQLDVLPQQVTGSLEIRDNAWLGQIGGNVELNDASLVIADSPALTSIAPFAADSTPASLVFSNLESLPSLAALATISDLRPETLVVNKLPLLHDLDALANLHSVGSIHSGCEVMCSPDGIGDASTSMQCMQQVRVWTGRFEVTNNAALADIGGLQAIEAVGGTFALHGSPAIVTSETCVQVRAWRSQALSQGDVCGAWVDSDDIRMLCDRE
jgi:hypothetical protein